MADIQTAPEKAVLEVLDRVLVHLMSIVSLKPIDDWDKDAPVKQSLSSIPKELRRDVLNYRLVNRSFNDVYKRRVYHQWSFEGLPTEILEKVLDYLVPKPNILTFDTRSYLSLESFASVEPGTQYESDPESDHLPNFRLINQQCDKIAAKRQFARLTVQFSLEGFSRLQKIAERAHLAKHVVKLSYMVPRFYLQGKARFEELIEEQQKESKDLEKQLRQRQTRQGPGQIHARLEQSRFHETRIRKQMEKADNQRRIVEERIDAEVLLFALKAFTSLEQIRLMPLENDSDKRWFKFLKRYYPLDAANFSWTAACERAVNTLVSAVLRSNSMVQRFSCRLMILQAPLSLTQETAQVSEVTISAGIARLKCLELHVVDRMDIPEVRAQLSGLCKEVLSQAVNLEGLHIGFRDRVSIPLESVFNNVKLERLKYVGIHMWSLHDEEIIKFLQRHRESVKALRLRNVLLKEGSRWDRILQVIRRDLRGLKWISLRGIGYVGAQRFGAVFDDSDSDSDMHLHDNSDSDEEELEESEPEAHNVNPHAHDTEGMGSNGEGEGEAEPTSTFVSTGDTFEDDENESEASSDTPQTSHNGHAGTEHDEEDIGSESDGDNDGEGSELGQALHDNFISDSTMVYHSTTPESPIIRQQQHQLQHYNCDCSNGNGSSWEDLDDDGIGVRKVQWKRWEKWAVKRCELHDPRGKGDDP